MNNIKDYVFAKYTAINWHNEVNHMYDGKSYDVHLYMVCDEAIRYRKIVPDIAFDTIIKACWLHDVIEDCRKTYNDVKKIFGEEVANIVYALTNEKGKTRKERANDKYYEGIRETPFAIFVKMCDRIANVRYSKETNSRMFEVYKNENHEFLKQLDLGEIYEPMVTELNNFFEI